MGGFWDRKSGNCLLWKKLEDFKKAELGEKSPGKPFHTFVSAGFVRAVHPTLSGGCGQAGRRFAFFAFCTFLAHFFLRQPFHFWHIFFSPFTKFLLSAFFLTIFANFFYTFLKFLEFFYKTDIFPQLYGIAGSGRGHDRG